MHFTEFVLACNIGFGRSFKYSNSFNHFYNNGVSIKSRNEIFKREEKMCAYFFNKDPKVDGSPSKIVENFANYFIKNIAENQSNL